MDLRAALLVCEFMLSASAATSSVSCSISLAVILASSEHECQTSVRIVPNLRLDSLHSVSLSRPAPLGVALAS